MFLLVETKTQSIISLTNIRYDFHNEQIQIPTGLKICQNNLENISHFFRIFKQCTPHLLQKHVFSPHRTTANIHYKLLCYFLGKLIHGVFFSQSFQKELGKRAGCIRTLKRSVRDLTRSSMADAHWLQEQMDELGGRWEAVCKLSVSKQERLEAALQQVLLTNTQQLFSSIGMTSK